LPPSAAFAARRDRAADAEPAPAPPYFVAVGTLEPRKNHLMLLHVWREMAETLGPATPRLVLVGARGWDCENVLDLLERCDRLRTSVAWVDHLATPALRDLLEGATALLMPSFAEGFGLPVVEALAAGTPVLASDIPVFRGLAMPGVALLDPLDGLAWLQACTKRAIELKMKNRAMQSQAAQGLGSWLLHSSYADEFLERI
jgi:glycosyltransferase involved in cell wall biosynthesis